MCLFVCACMHACVRACVYVRACVRACVRVGEGGGGQLRRYVDYMSEARWTILLCIIDLSSSWLFL